VHNNAAASLAWRSQHLWESRQLRSKAQSHRLWPILLQFLMGRWATMQPMVSEADITKGRRGLHRCLSWYMGLYKVF